MLITTECVGAGHPDKICDQIADNILDKFLEKDPNAKVACEVFAAHNQIYIAGEVSTNTYVDVISAAWDILYKYGYNEEDFTINSSLHEQSSEINKIVYHEDGEIGAGDQGIMFGYATDETSTYMPLSYKIANELLKNIENLRVLNKLPWVKSDMKSQVTLEYDNNKVKVHTIILSIQHTKDYHHDKFINNIKEKIIKPLIKKYSLNNDYDLKINSNGSFIMGGPMADTGLTGRKIIVDNYGPIAHHGGGSFSGKDYTKVDRTGAYIARWIAKNIVAAKIAKKCEVQLAYAFGDLKPILLEIDTFNTSTISHDKLLKIINKHFKLKVSEIIEKFNMKNIKYLPLATYGHFGRDEYNYQWENIDISHSLKEDI